MNYTFDDLCSFTDFVGDVVARKTNWTLHMKFYAKHNGIDMVFRFNERIKHCSLYESDLKSKSVSQICEKFIRQCESDEDDA